MTEARPGSEKNPCQCPYCNHATKVALPFCQFCGAALVRCSECGKVLEQGQSTCPACGGKPESASAPRRQSH